jgi:hypothetical protein
MAKHAGVWARLRRSVSADPWRFTDGSAAGGPLEVLAVDDESAIELDRSAHDRAVAAEAERGHERG